MTLKKIMHAWFFVFGIVMLSLIASRFVVFAGDTATLSWLRAAGTIKLPLPNFLIEPLTFMTYLRVLATDAIRNAFLNPTNYFYTFSSLAVLGPIFEEILWRGPLRLTIRWQTSSWWWILMVALNTLFVLAHPYPIFILFFPAMLAAGATALIVYSGRIWPAAALHIAFNTFVFLFVENILPPFSRAN